MLSSLVPIHRWHFADGVRISSAATGGRSVVAKLDKDSTILAVLDQLWSRLGVDAFVLADHWEPDMFAVGIASPRDLRVLVYISTYQEAEGRFGYELELPPPPDDEVQYQIAGRGSGVSYEDLAVVIASHLKHATPPTPTADN
jgi:hypothetical protein